MKRLLPGLILVGLLLACTQYRHIPPTTPEGQACVAQCTAQQQQCRSLANVGYQQCVASRNIALSTYNRCRASGQLGCQQPASCFQHEYRCTEPYNQCFQACGGRIVEEK